MNRHGLSWVIVLGLATGPAVYSNTQEAPMTITSLTLKNAPAGKVLTRQGELNIRVKVENDQYSEEIRNTSIRPNDQKAIDSLPTLDILRYDGVRFLILSKTDQPGFAYQMVPATDPQKPPRIHQVRFLNWDLNTFLHADPAHIVTIDERPKASFMIQLDGDDLGIVVRINGKEALQRTAKKGFFTILEPINRFLTKGVNHVEIITTGPQTSTTEFRLFDWNKEVSRELNGTLSAPRTEVLDYAIADNVILVDPVR